MLQAPTPAAATRLQAGIHPMSAADVQAVAALFSKTFGSVAKGKPLGLERAIGGLYLDRTARQKIAPSLVSYDAQGTVTGFIGVHSVPFIVNDKTYQAAFCGGFMVDPERADHLLGPRLLRSVFSGPQDFTISDTANSRAEMMCRQMDARILPSHSLNWIRVFRPGSFATNMLLRHASGRLQGLGSRLVGRPFDLVASRPISSRIVPEPSPCEEHEIESDDEFATSLMQFTSHFAGRPDWSRMNLVEMVATARDKPGFGDVSRKMVYRAGRPIGLYHLHAKPSDIGRVLQIAAIPGAEQVVLDRLFFTAYSMGLAGLLGRTQPWLLDAMLTRKCQFYPGGTTLVQARDKRLLTQFVQCDPFLNGFAGQDWTRFCGGAL